MYAGREGALSLVGLPKLKSCSLTFQNRGAAAWQIAEVPLRQDSFRCQRDSLQELTLCGVGQNLLLTNFSWFNSGLPALRSLTVRNLGLQHLDWLTSQVVPPDVGPVHSLDVDDNQLLHLSGASTAALVSMTALGKLSMRKPCGADASAADRRKAVWSAGSFRCIAQLAAARPSLQLCL